MQQSKALPCFIIVVLTADRPLVWPHLCFSNQFLLVFQRDHFRTCPHASKSYPITLSRWAGLHFHGEHRSHQMSSPSCPHPQTYFLPYLLSFPPLQWGAHPTSCSRLILQSALDPIWPCLSRILSLDGWSFFSYKSNLFLFTGSFR